MNVGAKEARRGGPSNIRIEKNKNGSIMVGDQKVNTESAIGKDGKVSTPIMINKKEPEKPKEIKVDKYDQYVNKMLESIGTDKYEELNNQREHLNTMMKRYFELNLQGQYNLVKKDLYKVRCEMAKAIGYKEYTSEISYADNTIKKYNGSYLTQKMMFVYLAWLNYPLFDDEGYCVVTDENFVHLIGGITPFGNLDEQLNNYIIFSEKIVK